MDHFGATLSSLDPLKDVAKIALVYMDQKSKSKTLCSHELPFLELHSMKDAFLSLNGSSVKERYRTRYPKGAKVDKANIQSTNLFWHLRNLPRYTGKTGTLHG